MGCEGDRNYSVANTMPLHLNYTDTLRFFTSSKKNVFL
jgi:hypothetical protein